MPAVLADLSHNGKCRPTEPTAQNRRQPICTLERAIAIAADAGQIDKAGAPYILHPLRVMLALATEDQRIVAVLHDVCEDCPNWPLERLAREGFPPRVLQAIEAVTKREGGAYRDFIARAAGTKSGRAVRLADLGDNMDLSRIAVPSERDRQRMEKYRVAVDHLEAGVSHPREQ